ncbi:hypothetical protein AAV94_07675 [Lampropedia cohaerens]|uniref:Uncharacterized protein n=1 Tax=Lampropedia cohaerens TaxID=1610491 RepID=A0A0U1Q091_9BURK|nr:MarR family transcriptional regulator [Lampropedia cohaerens]KKW68025.1 hypothetical protein AAV94_07675 [Lampropedia cohaerens]
MQTTYSERCGFGMLLVGTARRWRAAVDAHLAAQGLSDATWAPLLHVARAEQGLSQKELAARIGIDGSSLVRLIDILASKGLLERQQDATDRRANRLKLTPAGRRLVDAIQQSLLQVESSLLAGIDERTLQQLTHALEQIDRRIAIVREQQGSAL